MVFLVIRADRRVHTVHRGGVLTEIVGADAGKVHFPDRHVRDQRDGGNLDHDAGFDRPEGLALGLQLLLRLPQRGFCPADIVHAAHHWKHDPQIPRHGGPQRGPQLGLKNLRVGEAQAQRPVSQEGVLFLRQLQAVQLLIPADIQGPQGHRPPFKGLQHPGVNLHLLVLPGQGIPAHVEEFRAEQTHAVGETGGLQLLRGGGADVELHIDADSVSGNRLCALVFPRLQGVNPAGFALLLQSRGLLRGQIRGQDSVDGVNAHHLSVRQKVHGAAHAQKGRNLIASGNDRGVGGGSSNLRHNGQNHLTFQGSGVRREQILGHHDHRLRERAQVYLPGSVAAAQKAKPHILHIRDPLPDHVVLHPAQHLDKLGKCTVSRPFCIVIFVPDQPGHHLIQRRIGQNLRVSPKDRRLVRVALSQPLPHSGKLGSGPLPGGPVGG